MKIIAEINRLRILRQDATKYLSHDSDKNKFISWYHEVGDCIHRITGEYSFRYSGYLKIIEEEPLINVKEKDIPAYTKLVVEFIDSIILSYSKEITLDEPDLIHRVDSMILQRVKKSRIIPIFAFLATAILVFAIFGIFRIKEVELDINKFADSKREEFGKKLEQINKTYSSSIKDFAEENKKKIIDKRNAEIKRLRAEINNDFYIFVQNEKTKLSPILKSKVDSSLIEIGTINCELAGTKTVSEGLKEDYQELATLNKIKNGLNKEVPILLEKYRCYNKQITVLIIIGMIFILLQIGLYIIVVRKKAHNKV